MQDSTGPWYKHFWPLFMFGMISTVVIASLITVYIAIEGSDDLVNDNYYKDGLGINMQLDETSLAKDLNAHAEISITDGLITLKLTLNQQNPDQLVMNFSHPADDKLDKKVFLFANAKGLFEGAVDVPAQRFYVYVQGAHQGKLWRLSGEITPNASQQVILQSH